MRKEIWPYLVYLIIFLTSLAACATLKSNFNVPAKHPYELEQGIRPTCTECHDPRDANVDYQRFNHNVNWALNHRQAAYQRSEICAMCHQTSFCNDCHNTGIELKPSIKNQTENTRWMPHRGDYLSRHRIDGRLDPTSCFRCHGNPKASKTCVPCHG